MYVQLTVGKRGEIVIPAAIRKAMRLQPGAELLMKADERTLEIVPKDPGVMEFIREFAKEHGLPKGKKILMGDELYEEVF